ncbi:MAG: alpha/beta fold hydrolase [Zoogloeaceae bacterium]|jgi:pimeloyl-[acyl-carrier protein] methyl ester esterase|nr:alpha/beta fold hydrolase [Zoogloeaceae bacterium]
MNTRTACFLPGWGLGSAPLARAFRQQDAATRWQVQALPGSQPGERVPECFCDAVETLLVRLPEKKCHLGGWSLGAILALALAARAPERIASLTLIAATPCFVARPDWRNACPPATFRAFTRKVERDGDGALPAFIAGFCQGDQTAESSRHFLEKYATPPSRAALAAGLRWLAEADLRTNIPAISCPVYLLHGENDPLTPLEAALWLARTLPQAHLTRLPGKAHAPFLNTPAPAHFLRKCAHHEFQHQSPPLQEAGPPFL